MEDEIIRCKRCGKVIQIAPTVLSAFCRATKSVEVAHLCPECEIEFWQWLKGGKKLCSGKCKTMNTLQSANHVYPQFLPWVLRK